MFAAVWPCWSTNSSQIVAGIKTKIKLFTPIIYVLFGWEKERRRRKKKKTLKFAQCSSWSPACLTVPLLLEWLRLKISWTMCELGPVHQLNRKRGFFCSLRKIRLSCKRSRNKRLDKLNVNFSHKNGNNVWPSTGCGCPAGSFMHTTSPYDGLQRIRHFIVGKSTHSVEIGSLFDAGSRPDSVPIFFCEFAIDNAQSIDFDYPFSVHVSVFITRCWVLTVEWLAHDGSTVTGTIDYRKTHNRITFDDSFLSLQPTIVAFKNTSISFNKNDHDSWTIMSLRLAISNM